VKARLENIRKRIKNAALKCGRNPETIRLVAVSKTMPAERVKTAIEAGVTTIGENYIQEAREKFNDLSSFPVSWHFIGHLQTNKAKYAVRMFDLIQTLDSVKLAKEIDKQAKKIDKVQSVLLQINIGQEETKSGVDESEVMALIAEIGQLKNIAIKGLMTIPPFFNQPELVRPYFKTLSNLRQRIESKALPNVCMDELSMGMTGDFEVAIEEGATMVRIGTAIFGSRQ